VLVNNFKFKYYSTYSIMWGKLSIKYGGRNPNENRIVGSNLGEYETYTAFA
jgi:hypothetical protein